MIGDDRGYRIARLALMDAVRALSALPRDSFVLVGAHAVYHHAPVPIASSTPFTLDGDLAADPRKVRNPRRILDAMTNAGFELREHNTEGLYELRAAPKDAKYAARVDILVPGRLDSLWDFETYDGRGSRATMSQDGLELCLIDCAAARLYPVGSDDERESVEVRVAGILALLVAKGYKIGERHSQGGAEFEEVSKDIGDIYRLLLVADFDDVSRRIECFDAEARAIPMKGIAYIATLCGRGGDGCKLLSRSLGKSLEAQVIVASLESLAGQLHVVVAEALAS